MSIEIPEPLKAFHLRFDVGRKPTFDIKDDEGAILKSVELERVEIRTEPEISFLDFLRGAYDAEATEITYKMFALSGERIILRMKGGKMLQASMYPPDEAHHELEQASQEEEGSPG